MRKPFDELQHKQDDEPAKEAVQRFLSTQWKLGVIKGTQYNIDLICYRESGVVGYVEVERRHNWIDTFPFKTVHVPARKAKFFELDNPTILFSVRSDLAKALWCDGEKILQSPVKLLNNKHCKDEDFFVVPLEHWTLVDL